MTSAPDLGPIRSEFIEKVGLMAQGEGLPKTAGRMFGMFIFDNGTVSFGDLARRLQVSRASVSSSVRMLEDRGVLKRVSKPGERQDYFQLTATPHENMLKRTQDGVRQARDEVLATANSLPDSCPEIKARIGDFAGLYAAIDRSLGLALDHLNEPAPEASAKE
ncbi:MarR family transcriptional regulator [Gymnodinialimonas sp. 57CJ19]|uniref:GbsR/MarR family transcriptional regulator n=1 Tax=Gymnodinialimonas sp. 57CJ19 TaxID=3138498 RepID=UPI003134550B